MRRLSTRVRLAYGVADVGASLSFVALNTWLLYFLVNIAGLAPLTAGVVFVSGRLFDALLDPLMGLVSDRLKGRWGRLPFLRWGALPLGASFALLWLTPLLTERTLYALAAFGLFSLLYTVVQVPYMALTPELAPDYDERTTLSAFRVGFGTLASLLAVALPPVIVLAVAGGGTLAGSAPTGWIAMGIGFGLVTAGAYAITAAFVPEPPTSAGAPAAAPLQEVRSAFGAHGFGVVLALFVVSTAGLMVVNSALPFFLESALQLPPERQPQVLGLLFGVAILAFPLWNALAARTGKRGALVAGLLLLATALLLLTTFAPAGGASATLWGLTGLAGVGLSAVLLFPWAMLPDVIEFDELASGRRREGLLYALFTFGQKTAGSVGVFANALVAAAVGYEQGSALQDPATVAGIRLMTGPGAAVLFALAALLAWRFPITRGAHEAVRARLAERTR